MAKAGDFLGLGRSPGERDGNVLQYSCLENPTDRGAWWAMVHRVAKSGTRLKCFSSSICSGYYNHGPTLQAYGKGNTVLGALFGKIAHHL